MPAKSPVDLPRFEDIHVTQAQLDALPQPKLVNVVMHFKLSMDELSDPTNIQWLLYKLPGFAYQPKSFAAIMLHIDNVSILDFTSKKTVAPGSSSVVSARVMVQRFANFYTQAGIPCTVDQIRVDNMVYSVHVPFEVDIKGILQTFGIKAKYDKDKFPGLTFKGNLWSNLSFSVFVKGSIGMTGETDPEKVWKAWWWFYTHVLLPHRRGDSTLQTNSANYRREGEKNTIAAACKLVAQRRLVAPGEARAPRTPFTPVTPSYGGANGAAPTAAELGASGTILKQLESQFATHAPTCAWVTGGLPRPDTVTRALAGSAVHRRNVLAAHVEAGCVSARALTFDDGATAVCRVYAAQLIGVPAVLSIRDQNALCVLEWPNYEDRLSVQRAREIDALWAWSDMDVSADGV